MHKDNHIYRYKDVKKNIDKEIRITLYHKIEIVANDFVGIRLAPYILNLLFQIYQK